MSERMANEFVMGYMAGFQRTLNLIPFDRLAHVAEVLLDAYRQGRQLLIMGNGGSAATASHMAADLQKNILGKHHAAPRFRVLALADNVAAMTAWANDVAYEEIFAEQVRTWARPGDIVLVISGSGNSPNIIRAVEVARDLGAYTIGFLGFNGGRVLDMVDLPVLVPSNHYGHIEDIHSLFNHLITAYIREAIAREEALEMGARRNGNATLQLSVLNWPRQIPIPLHAQVAWD